VDAVFDRRAVILFLFSGFSIITPIIAIVLFWLVLPLSSIRSCENACYAVDEVKKELGPKGLMSALIGAAAGG